MQTASVYLKTKFDDAYQLAYAVERGLIDYLKAQLPAGLNGRERRKLGTQFPSFQIIPSESTMQLYAMYTDQGSQRRLQVIQNYSDIHDERMQDHRLLLSFSMHDAYKETLCSVAAKLSPSEGFFYEDDSLEQPVFMDSHVVGQQ